MNREDIIKLARDCGINFHQAGWPELERFASLVAAHTRETEFKPYWNNYRQGVADGAAAENEKLAAEAERNGNTILAMQIRARGQV